MANPGPLEDALQRRIDDFCGALKISLRGYEDLYAAIAETGYDPIPYFSPAVLQVVDMLVYNAIAGRSEAQLRAPLNSLRKGPWAIAPHQVVALFGHEVLTSRQCLKDLVKISRLECLETLRALLSSKQKARMGAHDWRRGVSTSRSIVPEDTQSILRELQPQPNITQRRRKRDESLARPLPRQSQSDEETPEDDDSPETGRHAVAAKRPKLSVVSEEPSSLWPDTRSEGAASSTPPTPQDTIPVPEIATLDTLKDLTHIPDGAEDDSIVVMDMDENPDTLAAGLLRMDDGAESDMNSDNDTSMQIPKTEEASPDSLKPASNSRADTTVDDDISEDITPPSNVLTRPQPKCKAPGDVSTQGQVPRAPHATPEGAVASLLPNAWLTGGAVFLAIELFNPDPARWHLVQPGAVSTSEMPKEVRYRCLKPSHEHVVVQLNLNANHWNIVIIDLQAHRVQLYDPFDRVENRTVARRAISKFLPALSRGPVEWKYESAICSLRQQDSHNCGIYCAVFAISAMCGFDCPLAIRPDLWRRVFAAGIAAKHSISPDVYLHITQAPPPRSVASGQYGTEYGPNSESCGTFMDLSKDLEVMQSSIADCHEHGNACRVIISWLDKLQIPSSTQTQNLLLSLESFAQQLADFPTECTPLTVERTVAFRSHLEEHFLSRAKAKDAMHEHLRFLLVSYTSLAEQLATQHDQLYSKGKQDLERLQTMWRALERTDV